jgi:hypothetical protein
VLGEAEYQAAMASELNIAGLQRKVDQSVTLPPVFSAASSAQHTAPDRPESGPGAADKPPSGDQGSDGAATQPAPAPENTPSEKH